MDTPRPLTRRASSRFVGRLMLITMVCAFDPAPAQVAWTTRLPANTPPARSWFAMAGDSLRGRVVLFSGGVLNDTWEWDGDNWLQRSPTNRPPTRSHHAMAYDAARAQVVLFGGFGGAGIVHGDTWTWDGVDWTLRVSGGGPPARARHAMAYDAGRGRVVLFGGHAGGSTFDDTWEWNGTTWSQMSPGMRPQGRYDHAMAHDEMRGRTVLFGGWRNGSDLGDTWEWDGSNWTQRTPAQSPPPGAFRSMAYDPMRQRTVLVAELFGTSTFEWDGTSWADRNAIPPGCSNWTIAFDSVRSRVLYFGDGCFRRTHTYGPSQPARYQVLGTGCAGTLGVPVLAAGPYSLPWQGDTVRGTVDHIPAGRPAVMALATTLTLPGWTLPLSLGPFGMPGCLLYVGPDLLWLLPSTNGVASWAIAIPGHPPFGGFPFHQQAVVFDPGANAAGLVVSNAITGVVGLR